MMPPQVGPPPLWEQPDEVPPPPRGPGVVAPFASPPRDRDLRGLWWSLGIGGLVAVLCCVGGIVGIVMVLPYLDSVGKDQVAAVVENYLTAVRDEDYAAARRQLCDDQQRTHTAAWFADHFGETPVTDFTVNADDVIIANAITVPARVREKTTWVDRRFAMEQAGTRYVICGGID
ncbi:hypothetical protein Dvina_46525 [Dactylosporangium vinaceum]|uniref:DUF4878 domain-containing protein n=1 Tax=Dactylosporangium vinaceum TaxID=53362 RepID=A0ABV5M7K9_9ACTN|nr:hypothetical protein [Dactylosporangium vinaceum]UAB95402.1 hypothetical protein Dvina_46525 [Dactylosporangium vinaceum]